MEKCNCEKEPSLFWLTIKLIVLGLVITLLVGLLYLKLEDAGVIIEISNILSQSLNYDTLR